MKHARTDILKAVMHLNLIETTNVVCVRPRGSETLRNIEALHITATKACSKPVRIKRIK